MSVAILAQVAERHHTVQIYTCMRPRHDIKQCICRRLKGSNALCKNGCTRFRARLLDPHSLVYRACVPSSMTFRTIAKASILWASLYVRVCHPS